MEIKGKKEKIISKATSYQLVVEHDMYVLCLLSLDFESR